MATHARALLGDGRPDEALQEARALLERVEGRRDVERAERIYLQVAQVFAAASDTKRATVALGHARAVVEDRLAHIRDARLRESYQRSWWVRAIRDEVPA